MKTEYKIIVDTEKDEIEDTMNRIAYSVYDAWVDSDRIATKFLITYTVESVESEVDG